MLNSVRVRLTLWYSAVLALVLLALAGGMYLLLARNAMLISGGFAGLAGVLFAWYNQFVGPVALSLEQSTQILIMVILGGIGTLYGQLFGALVVASVITERAEIGFQVDDVEAAARLL